VFSPAGSLLEYGGGFDLTEPDDAKVSRPVLRGLGLSNGPRLPYASHELATTVAGGGSRWWHNSQLGLNKVLTVS
jgi:hypothetical protein